MKKQKLFSFFFQWVTGSRTGDRDRRERNDRQSQKGKRGTLRIGQRDDVRDSRHRIGIGGANDVVERIGRQQDAAGTRQSESETTSWIVESNSNDINNDINNININNIINNNGDKCGGNT